MKELEPIKYTEETFSTKRECAICLVEYTEQNDIIILPCDARYDLSILSTIIGTTSTHFV